MADPWPALYQRPNYAFRGLIGREAFTFLAELCDLYGKVDQALDSFQLVVAALNLNCDLFLEALEILLGLAKLQACSRTSARRLPKSHKWPTMEICNSLPSQLLFGGTNHVVRFKSELSL